MWIYWILIWILKSLEVFWVKICWGFGGSNSFNPGRLLSEMSESFPYFADEFDGYFLWITDKFVGIIPITVDSIANRHFLEQLGRLKICHWAFYFIPNDAYNPGKPTKLPFLQGTFLVPSCVCVFCCLFFGEWIDICWWMLIWCCFGMQNQNTASFTSCCAHDKM